MADHSDSASLPTAFADAAEPEPTEPKPSSESGKASDKGAKTDNGLKSSGVPMTRLLGWAVPVIGVVAGVAMYNQSPPLAAGVFAVAFFVAFVMLVGTLIRRHTAKSSGSRSAAGGRGGASSPRAKRQWLPWSRRSGGGSGRPTGSGGRGAGGRGSGIRGLFNRGGSSGGTSGRSGIGRKSSSTGAGTKAPGSASTTGTGTKRSWNPLRRNRGAKSATGSSSPSGTKSTTSSHKSAGSTGSTGSSTPRKGIRGLFQRNRTGSGRSLRHPFRRTPKGSHPAGGGTGPGGAKPGSRRSRRQEKQSRDAATTQPAASDAKGGTRGDQKQRWIPWRRKNSQQSTSTHGAEGIAADTKPAKKRDRKRGEEKRSRVYGVDSDSASQHKEAARERKETTRTLKELGPIDDHGFQLFDSSKVKPSEKPAPRKAVDPDPIEVDDAGFEVYIPAKVTSINKLKEHKLSVDTSKYTAMVDPSTPQTLRNTLTSAGSAARVDAGDLAEQAAELRRSAAHMQEMKGMRDAAADMLREAAALDDTAEARLGMAAGFENSASTVSA